MNESQLLHRLIDIIHFKEIYQQNISKLQKRYEFILERIHMNENISPIELSKKYNLPPSTLTGQLDKLEGEGLIKRICSKKDRRSITLKITPEGENIIKSHKTTDELFVNNFFGSLDGHDREVFITLLNKLLENIDTQLLFTEEK